MTELPQESIRDLRAHLADVVERADRHHQPTVITRRGRPVAAVVSIDVLRRYQELEEQELNRSAGIPLEDVLRETLSRDD